MTTIATSTTIAITGELPPFVGVGVVAGGPVGMVVGPADGGDIVSEIGVGSAVGIPMYKHITV